MRLQEATPGDTDVESRYPKARLFASAVIAARCVGGTMMTSRSPGRLTHFVSLLLIISSTDRVRLF